MKKIIILLVVLILSSIAHGIEQYEFERSCPLNPGDYKAINANYGEFRATTGYKQHDGLDYQAGKGKSVYPVCGGSVTTGESSGWGKYVIVDSNKGGKTFQTRYAHLSKIFAKTGDEVSSETVIGLTGNTGISTGPTGYHLHFSFGPTVNPADTLNPIIHGLKQSYYKMGGYNKAAMIVPIDLKKEIISINIEKCIVFYNESSKKKVNASTTGTPLKIIAEAYHFAEYFPTNPYKIIFTIRKKNDPGYYIEKKEPEIIFKDLSFNQNDYYCFTEPFRTVSTKDKYNEYYYMDWIPTDPGTYEVEVKAYVAYWDGDNLIAPTTSNPDLGLTDTRTREIEIAGDFLYDLVDPTGMYAWEPPAAAASAAGIKAADTGWPAPKYANDLSNTIFTTNWVEVDPDFQKYTEFTYSAMRNSDFTVRVKDQSGAVRHNLYASGTEGEIKWDGSGVGEGTYSYEIEAKDPLTGIISTKEGISLITIDNTKPQILATAFPNKTSITQSEESTSIQFYPDEDLTSCMVNVVDATNRSNYIIEGLGKYPRLKANEVVNLTWDGAWYYGDGSYQFEVVMTDLAGNINKRYSSPITVDISGTYIPPSLGESDLTPPPYSERAIITDFAYDSRGDQYVLYGRQGRVIKYNSAGSKVAEDDQKINLSYPQAIAVSPATGRVYVADTYNNRVVVYDEDLHYIITVREGVIHYLREWRKRDYFLGINVGARVEWGGPYPSGSFYKPTDVVISPDGQVFVVDSANNRVLKYEEYSFYIKPGEVFKGIKYDASDKMGTLRDGPFLGWAETDYCYFYSSGINDSFNYFYYMSQLPAYENYGIENGKLTSPESAAVDSSGNLCVSDTGNHRIQKFKPDGSFYSKFGEGILKSPKGIDVDSYGNIFVADAGNQRIVQFNRLGEFVKEYKSDEYKIDPRKIRVREGKIYIADANHDRPLIWNIGGELGNVRTSSSWFSPGGNSTKGPLNIYYNLTQPADVAIRLIPKAEAGITAFGADGAIVLDKIARNTGNNQEVWDGQIASPMAASGTSTPEAAIPDGQYTLNISASFGDYVKTKTVDINIDNTKPSLSLTRDPPAVSPNADSVKETMLIDYSISDNLSPTAEIILYLWKDGKILDVLIDSHYALPVTHYFDWDGKIGGHVIEGDYIFELKAADLAGNVSISTAEVLVDNQPPRIEAVSISNPYFSPNGDGKKDDTEIKFTLSDTYAEKMLVTVLVRDKDGNQAAEIIGQQELSPGEYTFTWEGAADGQYTINIYAEDTAGNLGTSEPQAVTVDTIPPSIESLAADPNPFTPNDDGINDTTTFSFSLSEPCRVNFDILDDQNASYYKQGLDDTVGESLSWDGRGYHGGLLGGEYTYTLYAEDRAGNSAVSEPQIIIVDREPSLVPYAYAKPDPFSAANKDHTDVIYYISRDNVRVSAAVLGKEGAVIKNLVLDEVKNKGEHSAAWQGDYDPGYAGPYSSRDSNLVPDGAYEFKITAYDAYNDAHGDNSNTVYVDNTPPYITVNPAAVDLAGKTAAFSYFVPEAASIEVSVHSASGDLIEKLPDGGSRGAGEYFVSWDINGASPGQNYFLVAAEDAARNRAEKATELFEIPAGNELAVVNISCAPNPFTPNGDGLTDLTCIGYRISGGAPDYTVSVNILTETGSTVKRLVNNEPQSPGTYSYYWDGMNDSRQIAADGYYQYEVIAEDKLGTRIEERGPLLLVSTRPTVGLAADRPLFSPNGDGQSDTITFNYSINYPIQYISGDALVKLEAINLTGEAVWSRIFNHTAGSYAYEYEGTKTDSSPLPAGNYYLRATAQDALGSTAVPQTVAFAVDYTQPSLSDFTIDPPYAKMGTKVMIGLDFDEELSGDPVVTVVGLGPATLESVSGNSYVYSYTVAAGDPEGEREVAVEARDLALNPILRTKSFVIDKTDPQISDLTVSPDPASVPSVSGQVMIEFKVSEPLKQAPTVYVTQNGAAPQMAVVSGQWAVVSGQCEAKYDAIAGYDGPAQITIEVTDLANNLTTYQPNNLLTIDTLAPVFSNIRSEISSNPDFSTFAREGSEVAITFRSSEPLNFNPQVKVNEETATFSRRFHDLGGEYCEYLYAVGGGDAEGNALITISGFDFAGNEGTAETSSSAESFVIDLENPAVEIAYPGTSDIIASPSPFFTNADPNDFLGRPNYTTLRYETSEYGLVTLKAYKVDNSKTADQYTRDDFA